MRARHQNLVAGALAELAELIECAHDNHDHIELLVAYYPTSQPLEQADLDDLLATLNRDR